MTTQSAAKTLLLVDGSSYLYRAFHAMAPLMSPQGEPTGALYGVLNMLRRLRADVQHDYCCCIFDAKGKNFRHTLYPEYKATRPPMPDDLRPQTAWVRELVKEMGWPVLDVPDVEADDVIATLAVQAAAQDFTVIISTGDKDIAQLVNANITLVNTMSNEILDTAGVINKFGVEPSQIIDYLTLVGDKVDNVPGVEKCGPKTAVKWLNEYHSLDNLMAHADEISGKVGGNLRDALAWLPLSKQLITLNDEVDLSQDIPQGLADLRRQTPNWAGLIQHFKYFGFRSFLKDAEQKLAELNPAVQADFFNTELAPKALVNSINKPEVPQVLNYILVNDDASLAQLCQRLSTATEIGFDTETTSLHAQEASLVGMSFAFAAGDAAYIPVAHSITAIDQQLDMAVVLEKIKPYLESEQLKKIGQNIKYDEHVLFNYGIKLAGIAGDSMLASYVVESHLGHGLDELAQRHLGLTTVKYEDLCGKGAKQISFADVAIAEAKDYACQDADFCFRLEKYLVSLMAEKQLNIYHNIELPVSEVLFSMERYGVLIDAQELMHQSNELGQKMLALEEQAYEIADQNFNLNSPKQLQEILFVKMGIPTKGLKKTATGTSTNEEVLEKLALDYPLPKLILTYRGLAKLQSTYTSKLPQLINPQTHRVHTTYAQAVAITGRLASNNPNLQNIPIRTAEGRKVRKAFIAPVGSHIISADYSQIELRIMAHLSDDATLIDAFLQGQDVHKRTAAEIFHIAQDEVTSEQRRYAKTINFGLIYGMGQYGLAKSLGIENSAAKNFIDRYFARYPGVAEYMERTKRFAREYEYVETLLGRRLYMPEINSTNGIRRAGAERAAINAPMQGTASDLIKLAMKNVYTWLEHDGLATKLMLQVHDELVLEVPDNELELVKIKLAEIMNHVFELKVPLVVDVGMGLNWDDAH